MGLVRTPRPSDRVIIHAVNGARLQVPEVEDEKRKMDHFRAGPHSAAVTQGQKIIPSGWVNKARLPAVRLPFMETTYIIWKILKV